MNRFDSFTHEDLSLERDELDERIDREIRRLAEPALERFTAVGEAKSAFHEVSESINEPKTETESDAAVVDKKKSRPSRTCPMDEVDFYRNPTILSRLILNQKYESAIKRLRKTPNEASMWVCAKRRHTKGKSHKTTTTKTPFSFRQLPIHFACTSLGRECDSRARSTLNELIKSLIVANPAACREVDHNERSPLHEAISHGAMPETISMFLMAYPKSVHSPDRLGRAPMEINQYGTGERKKQVEEMLSLNADFWAQAHNEAILRLKHASTSVSLSKDSQTMIPSTGVPASSKAGEKSEAFALEECNGRDKDNGDNEISSIAWEQLEERAISLEQILTEMNEKNYELNHRIEALSKGKLAVVDKLDKVKSSILTREVVRLQQENEVLNQKLYKMELLVREAAVPLDPDGRKRLRGEVSLDVLQWNLSEGSGRTRVGQESLVRKNVVVQQQYADLHSFAQQDRIRQLEMAVDTLAESATEAETLVGSHSFYRGDSLNSEMSTLTDPDQNMSFGSSDDHEYEYVIGGRSQPPLCTRHLEVAWALLTASNLVQALGTDDLSDILYAAARSEELSRMWGSPGTASI